MNGNGRPPDNINRGTLLSDEPLVSGRRLRLSDMGTGEAQHLCNAAKTDIP